MTKRYEEPELTRYGDVEELTAGSRQMGHSDSWGSHGQGTQAFQS